jgi:hypothetical protein
VLEFKYNQQLRLPVRMMNATGDPLFGITFSQIEVTIEKADGTLVDFVPNGSQFFQVTQTAFADAGKYTLILPASFCDQIGLLVYAIANASARTYLGTVKLLANEQSETHEHLTGKWEIFTSGPDENRLVLYRPDGSTVLQKYNLHDKDGAPTSITPYRRTPVP